MDKNAVADILEEVATLLDIRGEVVFKSRAYLNAARTLRTIPDDLEEMVAQRRLGEIKGFGKALVEKITTLVSTGSLPYLDELRSSVPPATLQILKIPGLGAKKASALVSTTAPFRGGSPLRGGRSGSNLRSRGPGGQLPAKAPRNLGETR